MEMCRLARRLPGALLLVGTALFSQELRAQGQVLAPPTPSGTPRGRVPLSPTPGPFTPLAPSSLSYPLETLSVPEAQPIVPLVPSTGGGAIDLFALAPGETLPAGLTLDPQTGIIAGTPTALTPPTLFTVIASNAGGETSTDITIEVFGVAPAGLQYTPGTLDMEVGGGPYFAFPTCRGGPVDSYV